MHTYSHFFNVHIRQTNPATIQQLTSWDRSIQIKWNQVEVNLSNQMNKVRFKRFNTIKQYPSPLTAFHENFGRQVRGTKKCGLNSIYGPTMIEGCWDDVNIIRVLCIYCMYIYIYMYIYTVISIYIYINIYYM